LLGRSRLSDFPYSLAASGPARAVFAGCGDGTVHAIDVAGSLSGGRIELDGVRSGRRDPRDARPGWDDGTLGGGGGGGGGSSGGGGGSSRAVSEGGCRSMWGLGAGRNAVRFIAVGGDALVAGGDDGTVGCWRFGR